jgi:integrase
LHSKAKKIQLGSYPAMSLGEARELAREKRKLVKVDHVDPILESMRVKQQAAKDADNTFQKIAEEWLAVKKHTLVPSTHLKIKQTFNANVYGVFLQISFAQRPCELRESKWSEFDLDNAVWTLPLPRSKTRKHMPKPQTIMLSRQAIAALKELKAYAGSSEYLFAARLASKPVSEATIRKDFRTMFTDYHTVPHGCRHFFSTQANESGLFRSDAIEAFISHKDKDKIRATYNEATYDKERMTIAQWWSDQLDIMPDGAKVLPFKQA